jgi:hypothetical protein
MTYLRNQGCSSLLADNLNTFEWSPQAVALGLNGSKTMDYIVWLVNQASTLGISLGLAGLRNILEVNPSIAASPAVAFALEYDCYTAPVTSCAAKYAPFRASESHCWGFFLVDKGGWVDPL